MKKRKIDKKELLRHARLFDDVFMSAVFDGNIEAAELVLKIILDRPEVKVKSVKTQDTLNNLYGHWVRLDIHAIDEDGNEFDVEIQRSSDGADAKRARYNSSMLDSHMLKRGQNYEKLRDSYVIFITEKDVIGRGLPVYYINRRYDDNKALFDDGESIIYVNGAVRCSDTELGKLMQDFFNEDPEKMNYKELAERAGYLKNTKKGVKKMESYYDKCMKDIYDEGMEQGMEQGIEQGAEQKQIEVAIKMIARGDSINDVADITGLSVEKVTELAGAKAS